jgi:hypothetical protein
MNKIVRKTVTDKIFENILFLAEVFGDQEDNNVPKIPILEMAQCFELPQARKRRAARSRHREWRLWK